MNLYVYEPVCLWMYMFMNLYNRFVYDGWRPKLGQNVYRINSQGQRNFTRSQIIQ